MVRVDWKGESAFVATPPSGRQITMDTYPHDGQITQGPTPLETFLAGAAACSAVDVIGILTKKRQKVTSYRVEIEGDRTQEGQFPRPYVRLVIRHILEGDHLDPAAVARAVELSDNKYCSVIATLRQRPEVISEYEIHPPSSEQANNP